MINYDLPRQTSDYIHRVGRTARAGRRGRAICLLSQYDIELFKHIEDSITNGSFELLKEIKEEDILKKLSNVTTAIRKAKMKMIEYGFDEKLKKRKQQNQKKKKDKFK